MPAVRTDRGDMGDYFLPYLLIYDSRQAESKAILQLLSLLPCTEQQVETRHILSYSQDASSIPVPMLITRTHSGKRLASYVGRSAAQELFHEARQRMVGDKITMGSSAPAIVESKEEAIHALRGVVSRIEDENIAIENGWIHVIDPTHDPSDEDVRAYEEFCMQRRKVKQEKLRAMGDLPPPRSASAEYGEV